MAPPIGSAGQPACGQPGLESLTPPPSMSSLLAALLIAVVGGRVAPQPRWAESGPADVGAGRGWTAEDVSRWASSASPAARLWEAERCALLASRQDATEPADRRQLNLMQSVLAPLTDAERNTAAGEALSLYYQMVGLETQLPLLEQAEQTLDSLLAMAERAEELGLRDADPDSLRRQLLEIEDQRVQAEFGIRRGRRDLARRAARPAEEGLAAALTSPLPRELAVEQIDGAVELALAQRGELRAARTLCRCLDGDTLPAARALLGVLRPGLGLAATAAGSSSLLAALHRHDSPPSDLAPRRRQCLLLQESLRESITAEVIAAESNLWESSRRVGLARQQVTLAETQLRRAESAFEIGQAQAGSDLRARLEWLRLRGEAIQRRVELAVADVRLRQAQGVLADTPSRPK